MKKSWYWLIPIVVAFTVGYFLRGVWLVGLEQATPTGYEIFRDLLSILLALLVGTGTLLYLVIRREVREKVQDDIQKQFSKIRGEVHINLGLMHYYQGLYEEAIRWTKKTLVQEKNLDETEKLWAKNNLAYYHAAKHTGYRPSEEPRFKKYPQPENKHEAIKLAEYVYRKYDPLIEKYSQPAWAETCAFVKARFAETPEEKREAAKFIHSLLLRIDLQSKKEKLQESLDFLST